MDIVIYRYDSICEPDIIEAFESAGLCVHEITTEITQKALSDADRMLSVETLLKEKKPLFVFSINFYPVIADICHIYRTPYLCWTVDAPVPELFSSSILHDTNRIFLFDKAQYERFHPYNPDCIFYLPLASAVTRFEKVLSGQQNPLKYTSDISFVGSLYSEKNPLAAIQNFSDSTRGFIDGLAEAALHIYGYNPMEDAISDSVVQEIKEKAPRFYTPKNPVENPDRYIAAHSFLGYAAAEKERIRTLNLLAKQFSVDLYTGSDVSPLVGVHTHGRIQTLTEMPKVFAQSKINLNMTIKPICSGLPLRIFDILGCGGFLMTNFQSELTDYFTIGEDLEAYASPEELVEKCDYYLAHDAVREQIARNGQEKVRALHTYPQRMKEMLAHSFKV